MKPPVSRLRRTLLAGRCGFTFDSLRGIIVANATIGGAPMDLLSMDMHDITRCQNQNRREFMAQFELEGLHAKYIEALCREPGISQERLSKKLYVNIH